MDVFGWIIFGLIAGLIANMVEPDKTRGGLVGTTILGILGAVMGGFLANVIFGIGVSGFNILSFVIAIIGAIFLLYIGRILERT